MALGIKRKAFWAKVFLADGVQTGVGAAVGDLFATPGHIRFAAVFHDVPGIVGKQNNGIGFGNHMCVGNFNQNRITVSGFVG